MHSNEQPGRTSGLSTDDLASRRGPSEPAAGATDTEAWGDAATSGVSGTSDEEVPYLLTDDEERGLRDRWQDIRNRFVDDHREAVHRADALIADVMQTLVSAFAQHTPDGGQVAARAPGGAPVPLGRRRSRRASRTPSRSTAFPVRG
ncbi:hypothetical protein [Streptomyces olivaceoviridis]|uniref:hypothetical protein n=1 Tax=Streptomyces olivaceoviridis TaxID=1921 RepID=UPI0016741108|nr:hypothetical protein [Streptomyces olivaceoviridis]